LPQSDFAATLETAFVAHSFRSTKIPKLLAHFHQNSGL